MYIEATIWIATDKSALWKARFLALDKIQDNDKSERLSLPSNFRPLSPLIKEEAGAAPAKRQTGD